MENEGTIYVVAIIASALAVLLLTHWLYQWSKPKVNGVLPLGSMGIPLIGKSLALLIPTDSSFELHPFLKKRTQRYGTFFRTRIMSNRWLSQPTRNPATSYSKTARKYSSPGTTHHRCLKEHENIISLIRGILGDRFSTSETSSDDLLSRVIRDRENLEFLTEDFIVKLLIGLVFVSVNPISTTLTLVLKFLEENPKAMKELTHHKPF